MYIEKGPLAYQWIEHWAVTPADNPSSRANGRTHGAAVAKDGTVYVFHQAQPAVLTFNSEGEQIGAWSNEFPGAHGMTLVEEADGTEYLWLTDEASGLVAKTTLTGETVMTLPRPDHPAYAAGGRYSPTWAAQALDGRLFVTDGYGSNLVHRFDPAGEYLGSLTGEEEGAAGVFRCPHAIFIDMRRGEPELYIADRGNRRVQVYDIDGCFRRSFGEDIFVHPCAFAAWGEYLFVPELYARLAVLDGQDKLVGYIGQNDPIATAEGWPGASVPGWPNLPADQILVGKFNSPHGVATDPRTGDVYVVEWIVGGRITRLAQQ